MTVAQLIQWLQENAMPSDKVVVTWEAGIHGYSLYPGADGVIVIDADDNTYREDLEGKVTGEDYSAYDVRKRIAKGEGTRAR